METTEQHRLFAKNLGLAYWAAKRYGRAVDTDGTPLLEHDERRQIARIALWKAITKYDPNRGAALSTWASRVIINAILSALESQAKYRHCLSILQANLSLATRSYMSTPERVVGVIRTCDQVDAAVKHVGSRRLKDDRVRRAAGTAIRMTAEGYERKEIAELLDLSRERVRQLVGAVRTALEAAEVEGDVG